MAELEVLRAVTATVILGTCAFLISEFFRDMRESRNRRWTRRIDASGHVLSDRAAELKEEALRKAGRL